MDLSYILFTICALSPIWAATAAITVTDIDLQKLGQQLLDADVNNCGTLVTVNPQGTTCYSCTNDGAPAPLLTVAPEAYRKPTVEKLIALHDNYVSAAGVGETVTNEETREEQEFLDAIMTTTIMRQTETFLKSKGLISTITRNGNNPRAFRDALHQIWFGLYSRGNRTLGSSGFEHVFLGEVKDGKVSGFHNWVFYGREESANRLNYRGRVGKVVDLGTKGKVVKQKFDWEQKEKPVGSIFVGTSPEFEVAIYTVCYYARPNGKCPMKLNGKTVTIQTYFMNRQGKRYVASAYPDI